MSTIYFNWPIIVGGAFAFFFLILIGFLIYRCCVRRRQDSMLLITGPVAAPVYPSNYSPWTDQYPNASITVSYPTGPLGFPAAEVSSQPPYPTAGGVSQAPYPAVGTVHQSGAKWDTAWNNAASAPPPYQQL